MSILHQPITPLLDWLCSLDWDSLVAHIKSRTSSLRVFPSDDPAIVSLTPLVLLHTTSADYHSPSLEYLCSIVKPHSVDCMVFLSSDLSFLTIERLSYASEATENGRFHSLPPIEQAELVFQELLFLTSQITSASTMPDLQTCAPLITSNVTRTCLIISSTVRTFPFNSSFSASDLLSVLITLDLGLGHHCFTFSFLSNYPMMISSTIDTLLKSSVHIPTAKFLTSIHATSKYYLFQTAADAPSVSSVAISLACCSSSADVELFCDYVLLFPKNITKIASGFTPRSHWPFVPETIAQVRKMLLVEINADDVLENHFPIRALTKSSVIGLIKPLPKVSELESFFKHFKYESIFDILNATPHALLLFLLSCSDKSSITTVSNLIADVLVPGFVDVLAVTEKFLSLDICLFLSVLSCLSTIDSLVPRKLMDLTQRMITVICGVPVSANVLNTLVLPVVKNLKNVSLTLASLVWVIEPSLFVIDKHVDHPRTSLNLWIDLAEIISDNRGVAFGTGTGEAKNCQNIGLEFFEGLAFYAIKRKSDHNLSLFEPERIAILASKLGIASAFRRSCMLKRLLFELLSYVGYDSHTNLQPQESLVTVSSLLLPSFSCCSLLLL
ncbi:hypothetical protein GEMRC1_013633 [Eukaryota sp. GEM-RC1]